MTSNRLDARLARADAHGFFEIDDEHFAVADLSGSRDVRDRLDDLLGDGIVHRKLDLRLR